MRRIPAATSVALAAALTLFAATVTIAQDGEPVPTPPPNRLEGVTTALIMSALTDPVANEIILNAGREAQQSIGGRPRDLWTGTLERPENVAIAARDLAELDYRIVVITGGDRQVSVGAANAFPNSEFLDIGQPLPCVTASGIADPSGTCDGGVADLPPNYSVSTFAVDQPAYLAGVIAASASREDRLGIIGGQPGCDECERAIEGFTLGARSVKPDIMIELAYLADDDVETAFGDPATAMIFAEAFINVYSPDVIFPVAGGSSRGMIEAACDADILAVGFGLDVSNAQPALARCILTSVTRDLAMAVREAIFSVANESTPPQVVLGLANRGVGLTEEWRGLPSLPSGTPGLFEEAQQAILSGFLDTCPTTCGTGEDAEPEASPAPDGELEADA